VIGKAGQGMAGEEWERMGRGVAGSGRSDYHRYSSSNPGEAGYQKSSLIIKTQ